MALKLYTFAGTAPVYTPTTKRGAWDDPNEAGIVKLQTTPAGTQEGGSWGPYAPAGQSDYDGLKWRGAYVLTADTYFSGTAQGVIGMSEDATDANASLHVHAFVLAGQTETVRGTILADHIDTDELSNDWATAGEGFSAAMTNVPAFAGDVLVLEVGFRSNATTNRSITMYWGGTGTDLADNGNALTANSPCWIQFDTADPANPNPPTLDSPAGSETWRELSLHNITYTPASPEQSQGYPCDYTVQFSAAGTFADAVEITSGLTGGSYPWTLAASLVAVDTATCKIRIRAEIIGADEVSTWTTSAAFTVAQSTTPVVSMVTPATTGTLMQGLFPTFTFGTADVESDDVHVDLEISSFADYRTPVVDSDSTTDYANWTEAANPYSSWTTMPSGGATAANRIRYTVLTALRYDVYYVRVRLKDTYQTSGWTEFTFIASLDPTLGLSVIIGGTAFDVTACMIVENTGGEASTIDFQITLSEWLAHPLTKGDAIAISSGLGGWSRTWNGTVESWTFSGSIVNVHGLQDDAYLSRKVATGDEGSADLGQNLADFITSYGSPLTGTAIDTVTGVTMALTGGYKYIREHFIDALDVLPGYIVYVDAGGDIHFADQADLPVVMYSLWEEDPS